MFSEYAAKYWAVGLPVMPLRPRSKIPALTAWQVYCAQMPSEAEQSAWLESYADGNMGLPLGPASGVIALDLDSIDPRVQSILDVVMPPSPWKRIGKKGAVYAFKYNGERTYRIKDEDGNTILEVLSRGAQVVLPPSIHPDTQRPYTSNADLWAVKDSLPVLPAQFEPIIRQALIDAGFKLSSRGATKVAEWVPSGGRDSALVAMAGLLARAVSRKERDLLSVLNEMDAWIGQYTENVVGDAIDPTKGREKILEFLRRDVVEGGKSLPTGWDAGMTVEEAEKMREFFGEEAEEWTAPQIMDYIETGFIKLSKEDIPGRQALIEDVLKRVSRSHHLNQIDEDIILSFIQNGSGRMVTVSALRKHLKDLQGGDIAGTDHTEIAQALMELIGREGEVRFTGAFFYQWFGAHWRIVDEVEIMKRLMLEFGGLTAAKKFSDHKGIIQVCQKLVAAKLCEPNAVPVGINFANGYLTDDMELLNHEPRFGCTYVLPYRYVPHDEGRAPAMFMSFLDQSWGEDSDYLEKVQCLREAIAATLFNRSTIYQRAFCLFGVAGSGKTTLMDIILGLMPGAAVSRVPPQDWADRFLPTQMAGMLVNACGELSETQMIPGNSFKMIVEGAEMNGQLKGGQIFKFFPKCSQWFATNHLPRSRDTSAGFNRRWLILMFDRPVPSDQKRIGLAQEILAEEREAIVAWAIPAIQDLIRKSDYTLPRSHIQQISEVASQNNSVRFFLTAGEGVSVRLPSAGQETSRTPERDLFNLYYGWCKLSANVQPVPQKRFRMIMQELQSDLGFRLLIDLSSGQEVVWYTNIILVEKKARSK